MLAFGSRLATTASMSPPKQDACQKRIARAMNDRRRRQGIVAGRGVYPKNAVHHGLSRGP
jgi:hypothetical protein